MRLSRFQAAFMRANSNYFAEKGYEPEGIKRRVAEWLEGKDDKEIHGKIIDWMQAEVDWIDAVLPASVRQYWYFAPVVCFLLWLIRRAWRRQIVALERELRGQEAGVETVEVAGE